MSQRPPFRKNAWIPLFIIGATLTAAGATFLGLGIFLYFLISPFMFMIYYFPPMQWLLWGTIIGGTVGTIIGVVLIVYGNSCYSREKAWDQKMGLA